MGEEAVQKLEEQVEKEQLPYVLPIVFGKASGQEYKRWHMETVDQKINMAAGHSAGTQLQKVSEYYQNDQDSPDVL